MKPPREIRVIVVDDSPAMRDLLVALLQSDPLIRVVGTGANGEDAVRLVERLRPDVVTMDVRMPRLDGLEATRRVMREQPTPIVLVSGSMMRADIDLTFEALRAGALTVLPKPGLNDPERGARLVETVRLMADVKVLHHWATQDRPRVAVPPVVPLTNNGQSAARQFSVVGIGSSTGGPAALATVLRQLPAKFALPILVVQHMTNGFSSGLADWLAGETALEVRLAGHGERPESGVVLIAPDDYHMQVNGRGLIELTRDAPYKTLRPSANHLFHSLARVYGRRALGIILTGMGDDGAEGLVALHQAGGRVLAQDEASCVVYGMPREVVVRGAADTILNLDQISATLLTLAKEPQP